MGKRGKHKNDPKPLYDGWRLFCPREKGERNRTRTISAFLKFFFDSSVDRIDIPGDCILAGEVFGRRGLKNGTRTGTRGNVISIERVLRGIEKDKMTNLPKDLFKATTDAGEVFYLNEHEIDHYMIILMAELMDEGHLLGEERWDDEHFYVHPAYFDPMKVDKNFSVERFF